jgi:hypothetical protein
MHILSQYNYIKGEKERLKERKEKEIIDRET